MGVLYDVYREAAEILAESDDSVKISDVKCILEDAQSPITNKYIENLYAQVISKSHIDFGDIPNSKGDIRKYSGYPTMRDTLLTIRSLSKAENIKDPTNAVETVLSAITAIENLSDLYMEGYKLKNEYVMIEYNTFVYCCVEATSSILSEFVEFVKGFDSGVYQIKLKNTKYRANAFYVEQLDKFNRINATGNYRTYLSSVLTKEKDNFIGTSMVVGITAVAASVLIAIVPVSRSLVYHFYKMKSKLSDALALQAYFLELNKTCVEANDAFDTAKKEKILKKQENLRLLFLRMSDKLKVDTARAYRDSSIERKKDNASLTLGDTRKQVDSSPYDILL